MGEKTLCFVDRRCEACGGEGCEACGGTGIVGSIEEREPIPELADELADDRREKPLTEKYQALHAIDSAYRAFEQAVEQARCREDERQAAMALIVAAARVWLGEWDYGN